jgi:hypothetical protein
MKSIDIFFQREGVRDVGHLECDAEASFASIKARLVELGAATAEALLFAEDTDDPVDEAEAVGKAAGKAGVKLHVHRCRHIEVAVTFMTRTESRNFAPGVTVANVKRWAADKFNMSKEDATEHVLQLKGTHDRPPPSTHIGALVQGLKCRVDFDLVPNERVQG